MDCFGICAVSLKTDLSDKISICIAKATKPTCTRECTCMFLMMLLVLRVWIRCEKVLFKYNLHWATVEANVNLTLYCFTKASTTSRCWPNSSLSWRSCDPKYCFWSVWRNTWRYKTRYWNSCNTQQCVLFLILYCMCFVCAGFEHWPVGFGDFITALFGGFWTWISGTPVFREHICFIFQQLQREEHSPTWLSPGSHGLPLCQVKYKAITVMTGPHTCTMYLSFMHCTYHRTTWTAFSGCSIFQTLIH